MKKINKEMSLEKVLSEFDKFGGMFANLGFEGLSAEEILKKTGKDMSLETLLKIKSVNVAEFVKNLNEKLNEQELSEDGETYSGKLDFFAYMVCPLRKKFKEVLNQVLANSDEKFNYFVPGECTGVVKSEKFWLMDDINEFPDFFAAMGIGDYLEKPFLEKFIGKGYFSSLNQNKAEEKFRQIDFVDDEYTMYGATPYVMVLDKRKFATLPSIEKWEDLLKECYTSNIILSGHENEIPYLLPLYIFKDKGQEGVKKLAKNVKAIFHPSKIAKVAVGQSEETAAIYILPWFFAENCRSKDNLEIFWPKDGAIISPLYCLIKKEAKQRLAVFVEALTGGEFGKFAANNCYPFMNKLVKNKNEVRLKWLGWDYVKNQDMGLLKETVVKIFESAWGKK